MGSQRRWLAASTAPFLIWAMDCLRSRPNIIVHECTKAFDEQLLVQIFGSDYRVESLVFSPCDLGWPTSRPRKYTVMTRLDAEKLFSFSHQRFSDVFFRRMMMSGHEFWCAPADLVRQYHKDSQPGAAPEHDSRVREKKGKCDSVTQTIRFGQILSLAIHTRLNSAVYLGVGPVGILSVTICPLSPVSMACNSRMGVSRKARAQTGANPARAPLSVPLENTTSK